MILGIDYGKKRIGLALGQAIPKAAGLIENDSEESVFDLIGKICQENEVLLIVLGLPLSMNGEENEMTAEIREWGRKLQDSLGLPVNFEEEQLTSEEAERQIREYSESIQDSRISVDEMAAILILEQYLGRHPY